MSDTERNTSAASATIQADVTGVSRSPPSAPIETCPGPSQQGAPTATVLQQQPGDVPPNFFLQMMNVMQNMSDRLLNQQQSDRVKITDVFLPSYDPDGNVGVREWCNHISTAKNTYQLTDYDLRMKVTSLLRGRAKVWADNWLVTTSTWDELRQIIITTFEPESRYSRDVLKFREHTYDSSKDIAEFLTQSWILWRRVTKDKLGNSDAVEAVLGTIGDESLRIELMNARATSVPELISVASSIRSKRSSQLRVDQPLQKRARYTIDHRHTAQYCNFCKRTGHTLNNCRNKKSVDLNLINDKNAANPHSGRPHNIKHCSFCGKPGHVFDTCFRREKEISSNVNSLAYKGNTLNVMRMSVCGKLINTVFDSGAECSVMRESVANKLPGRRCQIVTYLRGIGPFPIISTSTLKAVCIIDDVNVEILFYILPDHDMTTDVLIGADILHSSGLSVIVTRERARLYYNPCIQYIQSKSPLFDKIDHDLTDEHQINQLLTLLYKYSELFTRGYSKTRVKTGELEIRLKNKDKYVERRPYRLSPVERTKVKDIVEELIKANIVRESRSPYSSPIILVRKKNGDDRMCVDYRELNANTIRDHFPLPLIADQIDQLAGGQYYTTLDMASGFHQIPISPDSIEKTAFVTPDGLYEYLTMPFGLCNAPSVYQRCINRALGQLLNPGCANTLHNDSVAQVYIDDVISKCRDFTSGISYLERIFIALRESGFSINIDKCLFFKRSIEYLGNVIENGQVRPSQKK
ncbi:uncharacterized protein LOC131841731 [Achroia grisella]|uniref:uncharacterized protein LOC131841731 n=1 Tax=Achroia grisella TaxID=688607 RepID=UPI0027D2ECB4|nr:uncharacterized protein LOC131841731 [Achroia grisella]